MATIRSRTLQPASWISVVLLLGATAALGDDGPAVSSLSELPRSADPHAARCITRAAKLWDEATSICGEPPTWRCAAALEPIDQAITVCHTALSSAENDHDQVLYALGYLFSHYPSQDRRCVYKHPGHLFWQEGAALCVTTNSHFTRLRERHPDSALIEDADYLEALGSYVYYECEGGFLCWTINAVDAWVTFLERHPRPRFREAVLNRVRNGLGLLFEAPLDRKHKDAYMKDDLEALLDRLDATIRRLAPQDGDEISRLTVRVREYLGRIE